MKFRFNENRTGKQLAVKDLLTDLVKEIHLEDAFSIEYIKEKWPDIAGSILSTHSIPNRIYGNTLFIEADHSVFVNDLSMMKKIILNKISSLGLNCNLKYIKVEVKKYTTHRRG